MAQITILKDNGGTTLYPITSGKAVFDENGVDFQTRITQITEELANRVKADDLNKALQTRQETLEDSPEVRVNADGKTLSLTERAKRAVFVDLVKSVAGQYVIYDETKGLFKLNDLWLTYEEITTIYVRSIFRTMEPAGIYKRVYNHYFSCRTYMPLYVGNYNCSFDSMLHGDTTVESFCAKSPFVDNNSISPGSMKYIFYGCSNLRKIPKIQMEYISDPAKVANAFTGCKALSDIEIINLKVSISFEDSQLLSSGSIALMLNNALNTGPITITVHPDVYAKLTDESNEEWSGLMALGAEYDITFTTK